MENLISLDLLARWGHVLFGITWIGILYYFNFIQTEYFKEGEASAVADVKAKLAPRALWWFRWGAMFTFLTGLVLLKDVGSAKNAYLMMGAAAGTLMFLNVWLIIWPNQQIALGLKEGDGAAAAPKAALASRTNTLLAGPMLLGMLGSKHGVGDVVYPVANAGAPVTAMYVVLAILVAIELNAVFGKQGPMTSVRGVITSSVVLTFALAAVLAFV